jgi:hypothetical protein
MSPNLELMYFKGHSTTPFDLVLLMFPWTLVGLILKPYHRKLKNPCSYHFIAKSLSFKPIHERKTPCFNSTIENFVHICLADTSFPYTKKLLSLWLRLIYLSSKFKGWYATQFQTLMGFDNCI